MKSERPDLPSTIATLVRSVTPVAPLGPTSGRLAQWTAVSTGLVVLSVVILGVRADLAAQLANGWFLARAAATLGVALGAAVVALLMSVPGLEPSLRIRALPVAACFIWIVMLVGPLAMDLAPEDRLLRVSPHPSCVLLIAATALAPGGALVRALKRGAPLQASLTAGLAGLASLALGAFGAQVVCADDAAAHHLLWHLTPVVLLTLASAAAGPVVLRFGTTATNRGRRGARSARREEGECLGRRSRD